ncbi:hypothetical protein BGZ98_000288 [Dissophora globulifera]|nr:hypothetical protein BGZ98_000288 [Dissophora globulifera]
MSIFEPARSAYSGFVAALTTQSHHTFAIKGSADIIFNLGFLGTHSITDVDFLSDLTLRGLNNLPEIQCMAVEDVTYSDIDHEGTAQLEQTGQNTGRHQLIVSVLFDIPNPSQLSLTLGDLTLGVSYGVKPSPGSKFSSERSAAEEETRSTIGTITLMSLILLQGMNKCRVAKITLDTRLEATQHFLKHIAEEPQMVHMQGLQGTSKNEALAGGLASLATSFTMPTFTAPAPQ